MHLPERAIVHDRYLSLSSLKNRRFEGSFAGKLLLAVGFEGEGMVAVLAANIAGLASLSLSSDPERLREGLRAGFCDFVVSHLDEALRILKNELRRGRAIAVTLAAELQPCLHEMLKRGLQPEILEVDSTAYGETQTFLRRGAVALSHEPPDSALRLVEWSAAGGERSIATLVAEALEPHRSDTAARRRWLEQSPAFLGRSFGPGQCLRMTPFEIAALRDSLQSSVPSVSLRVDGSPLPHG